MKKTISLLLALLLCLSLCAAAYADGAKLSIEPVDAKPGDELEIPVKLTGNPGFAYLKLYVGYDASAIELLEVKNTGLFPAAPTGSQKTSDNPYVLIWVNASNMSQDGDLLILRVRVLDGAPAETKIELKFQEDDKCFNEQLQDVAITAEDGFIRVAGGAAPAEPTPVPAEPTPAPTVTEKPAPTDAPATETEAPKATEEPAKETEAPKATEEPAKETEAPKATEEPAKETEAPKTTDPAPATAVPVKGGPNTGLIVAAVVLAAAAIVAAVLLLRKKKQ